MSTKAPALYKGAAQINKAIDSIKNRGAKLDASIQIAALSVLAHASEHGDTTCADRLVHAMPAGARKLALVEFILAFGQMRKLDKTDEVEALAIKNGMLFKIDRSRKLDMEGAASMEWYKFKPEAAMLEAFDAQKAVASLLGRLRSAAAKGLSIEHKDKAIAEAQQLLTMLQAE